MRQAVWW